MDNERSEVLLLEQKGSIAWITLNRPGKFNALSTELNAALIRACQSIKPDISVVVFRGAGKNFCAGSDLKDLYQADRARTESVIQLEMDASHALAAVPQLTVALLQGKCYGGGAFLPLYCDLRIGFPGVEFWLPEVAMGWVPPYGIERLFSTLSRPFALDLLLSGRVCGDKEALEKGLLNRLVDSEAEALSLVERLSQIPHRTLIDTVALARDAQGMATGKEDARSFPAFLNHFDTDYARRTVTEFVERKRN